MGADRYHATTYRTENPRMRALFDHFGFVAKADPDDAQVVIYSALIADLAGADTAVMARKSGQAAVPEPADVADTADTADSAPFEAS
jgi:hypothetical protein